MDLKTCSCGESSGLYIDRKNAKISGDCQPIGFNNHSIRMALSLQKQVDRQEEEILKIIKPIEGIRFEAFVIPKKCSSIKRKDNF